MCQVDFDGSKHEEYLFLLKIEKIVQRQ